MSSFLYYNVYVLNFRRGLHGLRSDGTRSLFRPLFRLFVEVFSKFLPVYLTFKLRIALEHCKKTIEFIHILVINFWPTP